MHTEAEAKTKWCPMARLSQTGGPVSRDGPAADFNCIGSGCMAWRTAPKGQRRYFVSDEGKPEEEWNWDPSNNKHYPDVKVRIVEPDSMGFCGLAGRDPA